MCIVYNWGDSSCPLILVFSGGVGEIDFETTTVTGFGFSKGLVMGVGSSFTPLER